MSEKLRTLVYDFGSSVVTILITFWFTCGWMLTWMLWYKLLFTNYFWISLAFLLWTVLDKAPNRGGRLYRPLRKLSIFKLWRHYFSLKVHVVSPSDITPDKNYIFGYHPHGYVGFGCLCCFATEAVDISKKLPGMRFTQLSTRLAYIHPIFRDFLMLLGIANASEENIRYMANKGTGNAMVLVIGGAAETLDARPGMHRLVLKNRKGFVRTALKTGCHLIPVYGFGENDIYDQVFNNPVGSRWRKVQRWVQAKTGVPILVYVYGPLKIPFWYPYRRPINVVVGKPIPVPHISHPTEQQIDKLHQQYKKALRDLFDTHKGQYGDARSEIEFI